MKKKSVISEQMNIGNNNVRKYRFLMRKRTKIKEKNRHVNFH